MTDGNPIGNKNADFWRALTRKLFAKKPEHLRLYNALGRRSGGRGIWKKTIDVIESRRNLNP